MTARELFAGASASSDAVYVEDVFSTYLYSGTGASQTITNGIDLATKGGLVWIKSRSSGSSAIFDTARGVNKILATTITDGQNPYGSPSDLLTAFNTNGFSIGADVTAYGWINQSNTGMASWTFRKQPKFFDIVTYTGDGVQGRAIPHSLGSTPGMVIVKCTSSSTRWLVYHRAAQASNPEYGAMFLNTTDAWAGYGGAFGNTAPTATDFYVGANSEANGSGSTYVAYLFAHDAGGFGAAGTDSVVACGSYTTNSSGVGSVTLGWEPQFIIAKCATAASDWQIFDNMRGFSLTNSQILVSNSSAAEYSSGAYGLMPNATGFTDAGSLGANATIIYLAIRRGPMKTPTDATKVFLPVASNTASAYTVGFPVDMQISGNRPGFSSNFTVLDRLRGVSTTSTELQNGLITSSTSAEGSSSIGSVNWTSVSFTPSINIGGAQNAYFNFRRAPGFFDVVCYTGDGVIGRTVSHNLGVKPELMIVKNRSGANGWQVYDKLNGATKVMYLETTDASTALAFPWNNTEPTSSVFTLRTNIVTNGSGYTYVAYLFATCPGVSKVGSYTGSGTTKQIDCGFTTGARFVLIKRTDSTGDWLVADTARGLVSGNDPLLKLNSTAAEVTTLDWIDPYSAGFEVVQESTANANVSGASYIYLAVA